MRGFILCAPPDKEAEARPLVPLPSAESPPAAATTDLAFRGWWMVLWCTIVRGATAPGQTIGVSAFTDDLIDSLGTSRSAVSTARAMMPVVLAMKSA